jgi:hypothetical protein
VHQEPPEVAWLEPELDDGADDELPRPLELPELVELEPDEPELDDPVLAEPELELDEPDVPDVPEVPEPELEEPEPVLPVLLLDEFVPVEALLDEPGSASATAPAASTLAAPTVAVVATTRPLARRRAATPRVTASRFGLFMS